MKWNDTGGDSCHIWLWSHFYILHLTSKMHYFQCTAKSLQDMKTTKNSRCTKYNNSLKSKYGLEGGAAWVEVCTLGVLFVYRATSLQIHTLHCFKLAWHGNALLPNIRMDFTYPHPPLPLPPPSRSTDPCSCCFLVNYNQSFYKSAAAPHCTVSFSNFFLSFFFCGCLFDLLLLSWRTGQGLALLCRLVHTQTIERQ